MTLVRRRKESVKLSQWHMKVLLAQQSPPRGVLVSFSSEGIPENNSNDTHCLKSIEIIRLKKAATTSHRYSLFTRHFSRFSIELNYPSKQVFSYKKHMYCKKINNPIDEVLESPTSCSCLCTLKTKRKHSLTLRAVAANTTVKQREVQSADDVTIISPQLEACLSLG